VAAAAKKILVVEDNNDWREVLTIIIKRLGYDVIAAATGEDGVAQAAAALPDLVLMDIGLPRMSGDQATAHLKGNATTKDIPVIIQTAFGMGPSAERALAAGAAEILHKPISMSVIEKVLGKYLPGSRPAATPI
jgi:CheY-like chemotaxis protein